MKVFDKLVQLDTRNAMGIEWIRFNNTSCPAVLENKYKIIGEKKMNKFCGLGCSVICMEEYLDLKNKAR